MNKREVVKIITEHSAFIDSLKEILRKSKEEYPDRDCSNVEEVITRFQGEFDEAIRGAQVLGFVPEVLDITIVNTRSFKQWAQPRVMDDISPSTYRYCGVEMEKLPEVFEDTIELPVRKAMQILMQKGWITDYSSANYKDAKGERFNMFVDRQNVAFIRFHDSYLTDEDRKVLMPGNHGLHFIYTPVWPEKLISDVEAELVELAERLPQPTYANKDEREDD